MTPSRSAPSQRWRRGDRLRTSTEFKSLLKRRPRRSEHFVVHARNASGPHSRLGLVVSRKVGNAVRRNRVKRRVREFFRTHRHLFHEPFDVIVRALPGSASLSWEALRDQLYQALASLMEAPEASQPDDPGNPPAGPRAAQDKPTEA